MNKRSLCIELADTVENKPATVYSELCSKMFYDPVSCINKIKIGKKIIPAVLCGEQLGTSTFTKANGETSDVDSERRNSISLDTMTHTEAQAESTDPSVSI